MVSSTAAQLRDGGGTSPAGHLRSHVEQDECRHGHDLEPCASAGDVDLDVLELAGELVLLGRVNGPLVVRDRLPAGELADKGFASVGERGD